MSCRRSFWALACSVPLLAAAPDGAAIYAQRCATCHDKAAERAPAKDVLAKRLPEDIVKALTAGAMKVQAYGLNEEEIRAIATYLTGKVPGASATAATVNYCAGSAPPMRLGGNAWTGWGNGLENRRYQPQPGLAPADVPRLKVKWAFGYPDRVTFGQPTLAAGRLFVSTSNGKVYALDPNTGCVYWAIDNGPGVRSAVQVGPLPKGSATEYAAYFGDEKATVHALDAATGKQIWSLKLDDHPVARITGSPVLYNSRLYVPISSIEEGIAQNPKYECCKFQGAVAAVDALSGKLIWKTRTMSDPPAPFQKNSAGTQMYGPAGAAVWSSPTIDVKRGLIYVGTGNSYTEVETNRANAILALDMETGSVKWSNQVTTKDAFIVGCLIPGAGNCPKNMGPDVDFGSSPVLQHLPNGKDVLLAGQKSGMLYAMDPDNRGKVLWAVQLGTGSALGGIEWGFAADDQNVYVPVSDVISKKDTGKPGLTAINVATGEKVWQSPAPKAECSWGTAGCFPALSAATTAIPGVVFQGSMDGRLRAHSTKDGTVVWEFDTGRAFETVNGVKAQGGSIDSSGPIVVDGTVFLNSGYGRLVGRPGNVLIALTVDGK